MLAKVNGTELFYTVQGSGRPIFIMHGGLGVDHTVFRPWLDPLGDRYQLIFYDHRGNGRSERPASLADVDHGTWAADADALREHLGHDRIVILGNSYGGILGQEYALRYGDRLEGLILVTSLPAWDYEDVSQDNVRARGTPEQIDFVVNRRTQPVANDVELRKIWKLIFPLYFKNYDPELGAAIDEKISYSAAGFNRGFVECLPKFNRLSRLKEIVTPTLVIGGRHDWIAPVAECAQRLNDGLPHSELVVFEDSGHFPVIEEQERFLSVVGDWLDRL